MIKKGIETKKEIKEEIEKEIEKMIEKEVEDYIKGKLLDAELKKYATKIPGGFVMSCNQLLKFLKKKKRR